MDFEKTSNQGLRLNQLDTESQEDRTADRKQTTESGQSRLLKHLTPENVMQSLESGNPITVKIKRSSGAMEDGWIVYSVNLDKVKVKKLDQPPFLSKTVKLLDLQKWNS